MSNSWQVVCVIYVTIHTQGTVRHSESRYNWFHKIHKLVLVGLLRLFLMGTIILSLWSFCSILSQWSKLNTTATFYLVLFSSFILLLYVFLFLIWIRIVKPNEGKYYYYIPTQLMFCKLVLIHSINRTSLLKSHLNRIFNI